MPKAIFASGQDSNMFYAVGMNIHDPFFYIDTDDKKYVFLDHRELGVFQDKNKNQYIEGMLLNPIIDEASKLKEDIGIKNKTALVLFQKYNLIGKEVEVPIHFPLDMADFLRKNGAKLIPKTPFFPGRIKKSSEEISYVRETMKKLTKAYDHIENVLRESIIDGEFIKYKNKALTSEVLKKEVEQVLLKNDLLDTEGMIVSCGEQAAIPHHQGTGLIRAHETIICDIFPRNRINGYYGDMTRTYVKGEPREEIKKMYAAVLEAQERAISAISTGKAGKEIHRVCVDTFLELGYETGNSGFIHGTGHGLGIDIHEYPYLNALSEEMLEIGNIFSIEPGLYYPEIGGVRIEDIIAITEKGVENLTNYKKDYIIS